MLDESKSVVHGEFDPNVDANMLSRPVKPFMQVQHIVW